MKTLLLTGGNDGIGWYMTRQWLEDGHQAAVLDVHTERLRELQTEFPDRVLVFQCDVRDTQKVREAAEQTSAQFGGIDCAVHNACLCLFKSFTDHKIDEFDAVMDVNFLGAVNLVKAVLPVMQKQGKGKVFLTSSGVGVTGFFNISAYACSKGAIESLAKCLNLEYAGTGITFHIMHPPLTATKSSSPMPIPKEFMAPAEKVGRGLARHMGGRGFVITPSFMDAVSIKMSYLFPLFMGRMMTRMTKRAEAKP